MASYTMQGQSYVGSLLALDFFSGGNITMLLNVFGSTGSRTLVDDSGQLYTGEHVTVNGVDYVFRGSGWAQPGVSLFGLIVPTGVRVDAILVQNASTGQLMLLYPEGPPNILSAIALVVHIDEIGYNMTTKGTLCFAQGTPIAVPKGWRAVEDLVAGDLVLDRDGRAVRVLEVISQRQRGRGGRGVRPVRLSRDVAVSQQHRLVVGGAAVELMFGMDEALIPAIALVDAGAARLGNGNGLRYVHVLTQHHSVLVAGGFPAETLLLGPEAADQLTADYMPEHMQMGLAARHPRAARRACLPFLSRSEGAALIRAGATVMPVDHPRGLPLPKLKTA